MLFYVVFFPAAFAAVTAVTTVTAAMTSVSAAAALVRRPDRRNESDSDQDDEQDTYQIHEPLLSSQARPNAIPTQRTRNAMTHATAHCISTVAAAALTLPSSRFTVAIAATHGV